VFLVQQALVAAARPGVSTLELDRLAEETIRGHGAHPAFKGYHGFPASICASVNDEAVHGFPRPEALHTGDILSVDVGVKLDGYFGDGAFSLGVGFITSAQQHLLDTTRAALHDGISKARSRGRLSDISHAIQSRAEANGMSVVREFGGHGIGRALHEAPHIPNYGSPGRGPKLQPGLVVAIEPILSMGKPDVVVAEDGWTTSTRDGTTVAHFEHTVAVTDDGPDVLTLPSADSRSPQ
jgi:methionyl aminopeptidase